MWDWLFQFFEPLDRVGLPYAIVGSVASSLYGEPRATNDVDIVMQMNPADALKLVDAFPSDKFYVPPVEVIEVEFNRRHGGHINVIALESMMKADIYPLSRAEAAWFTRRQSLEISGRQLWFAIPAAVILHKLRFYREGGGEKHLRDIRGMLTISDKEIDRAELDQACAELGLSEHWKMAQEL
jgi:hypothetical protein